ncbi:MAG: hypothetical protein ACKOQY_07185 [Bacteroidota bacterium]
MSGKRIRFRQSPSTRLRQVTLVFAGITLALGLGLLVFFNLAVEEEGKAASGMTLVGVSVNQDTLPVLRGSINQCVIGLVVETNGKGVPIALNSVTFVSRGTTLPYERHFMNARLWFTGNDPEFSLQETVGSTLVRISGEELVFTGTKELMRGKNHFWLTYDIPADASAPGAAVDAACREVRIGSRIVRPEHGNPAGKRFILPNIPFYSMGSLSLNKAASWNSRRDGSGLPPRQMNETRNSFFIQSGHRMISSTGGNLQTLVVEKGGELKITAPLRLGAVQVACGGVLKVDTAVAGDWFISDLRLESGSLYYHNSTGPLPAFTTEIARGSVQVILRMGNASFGHVPTMGSFRFEVDPDVCLPVGLSLPEIKGDLVLSGTGKGGFIPSSDAALNVGGDLVLDGGEFAGPQHGVLRLNVDGRFVMRKGAFSDSRNTTAATTLSVKGDVILLGGRFDCRQSANSLLKVGADGSTSARWIQREDCSVQLGNMRIPTDRSLSIKGAVLGPISRNRMFEVQTGAELLCEQAVVSGDGTFSLNDGATIGIGHQEGLHSKSDAGNVRTAGRMYHAGATYLFYTESDPQVTGKFDTWPANQAIRRMVVKKAYPSQALLLSQDIRLAEPCRVTMGDVRPNGFALLQD